jgi:nucleotide-binding universal stress UspA family protein
MSKIEVSELVSVTLPVGLAMIRMKKILYATDFSSHSNQAYFHAIGLAETYGSTVTILYVSNPASDGGKSKSYWKDQLELIRPQNTAIPVRHVLLEGHPEEEIVRYAQNVGFDVVVMGTHGRTGRERMLMGSVAEHVMREAPCSVLVVKMPKRQDPSLEPLVYSAPVILGV